VAVGRPGRVEAAGQLVLGPRGDVGLVLEDQDLVGEESVADGCKVIVWMGVSWADKGEMGAYQEVTDSTGGLPCLTCS
jgi:hypothetical protein